MRATSDSIWRRAAPELADSRSASRRSWVLPSMVALSVGDLVLELGGAQVGLGQLLFGLLYLLLYLGEFALEGQWALRARTAAGDGDVVEGLAGGGEEEGLRVRESKRAGGVGVRRDEAFAELGQDDFERLAEAVEDADALLEGNDAFDAFDVGLGGALHAFGEGEVGLGVVGMNEEGGAAADVGLEQVHAGVGGVPGS